MSGCRSSPTGSASWRAGVIIRFADIFDSGADDDDEGGIFCRIETAASCSEGSACGGQKERSAEQHYKGLRERGCFTWTSVCNYAKCCKFGAQRFARCEDGRSKQRLCARQSARRSGTRRGDRSNTQKTRCFTHGRRSSRQRRPLCSSGNATSSAYEQPLSGDASAGGGGCCG